MHHKRGKPKKARAGCLLCKPHKLNGENKLAAVSKTGFAKIRADRNSRQDMREAPNSDVCELDAPTTPQPIRLLSS